MPKTVQLPQLNPQVLSTLNRDGSRRWLTPRLAKGRLWRARLAVAWGLILLFTLLPWMRIDGRPPILLDIIARQFVFFGVVFRPTDTLLLALLFLCIFTGVFLLTAIVGRVWCGWGCPQTVYMEFVFRPIERLIMGRAWGKRGATVAGWRILAMYAVFLILSAHLANTFLAYFVPTDRLVAWTFGSPARHPTAFAVFAVTTALMMFDFCFFREQLCTLVCPYGRFQSVLLDRDSLVVGYDRTRGEPRGPIRKQAPAAASTASSGDCVDCSLCVQVCPTGIDIRDGLQMECINCTQCIDACNGVMSKVGRPLGLIRYSSTHHLEGTQRRHVRARLIVYPTLFVGALATLIVLVAARADAAVVQMRTPGMNYREVADGMVEAPLRLRIDNRTDAPRTYRIEAADDSILDGAAPVEVAASGSGDADLRVRVPIGSFHAGRRDLLLRITDDARFSTTVHCSIMGPLTAPPKSP